MTFSFAMSYAEDEVSRNVTDSMSERTGVLMEATKKGSKEAVKFLIDRGADTSIRDEDGNTLVMKAAYKGHLEVVKLLLNRGADINAKNKNDMTALMWAAYKGHKETVKLLIDRGADINAKNKYDMTPLLNAIFGGRMKLEIAEHTTETDLAKVMAALFSSAVSGKKVAIGRYTEMIANHMETVIILKEAGGVLVP